LATLNDIDKKVLKAYGYTKFTDFLEPAEENEPWSPIYTYNFEPNKPETIARQKMDDVKRKWLPKVIMTSPAEFDKAWEEYQATLKESADIKAYEDALTEEVRRRMELWG
ncbi:sugar ABC transporter substrate-binding protein, partial [Bacillus velezensis]